MGKKSTHSSQLTTVRQIQRGTLKRVLGIFDLFAIGYGDLGSSIYYALGVTALFAMGATPIALGLAGVVFICTALTYAEMTGAFHESGGSASFARHAFNDMVSFIVGWGLLLDYIVTIAISAFAVAPYLSYFFGPLMQAPVHLCFTVSLIAILFLMNFFGIKQSTRISLLLTGLTIAIQAVVIAIGFSTLLDLSTIVEHMKINVPDLPWSPSWSDFWKGTAMAMVAYTGIESIAQLGAEAKKPARTVPRAVVITMGVLIIMYLGISLLALSAVSPKVLGTTYILNPIAGIVDALPFGKGLLSPAIAVLAAVVLTVAANAGLVGASRLSFNMGEYYQLPRAFYKLHPKFRTPTISLAFFGIVACLIVFASRGRMEFLADLYNFGAMIAFASAHLSLLILRVKKPDLNRPFKIPFSLKWGKKIELPWTALIGFAATLSVWILVVVTKPAGRYLGSAWMLFGIAMYYFYRKRKKLAIGGHLSIEQIKIPDYHPIKIRNILLPTRGGTLTETLQVACEMAKMHKAKIFAIHVLDIPSSLPLDLHLQHRIQTVNAILKRAEAIAREFNVEIELKIIRSRSISETILEVARKGKFDLVVLGARKTSHLNQGLGPIAEKVLRQASCRVWVCT
jgi:APA family basic amino acid/polyamine antiporter